MVNDDRIDIPTEHRLNGDVILLLRGLAEIDHTAVNTCEGTVRPTSGIKWIPHTGKNLLEIREGFFQLNLSFGLPSIVLRLQ